MKKLFFISALSIVAYSSVHAQSTDSLFTSIVDGKHLLVIQTPSSKTLSQLSADYNVNFELLQLFNSGLSANVPANSLVYIPLTEQNYYKNPALGFKDGTYVPIFHTVEASENLMQIAKIYLVSETSLMRWNELSSNASLQEGQALLIGWLRLGNTNTTFNRSNTGLSGIKSEVASTVQTAKGKVSDAARTISNTTIPKPAIIDSTRTALRQAGADIQNGFAKLNTSFSKLQDNVTNSTLKLTRNVSTAYAREKARRERELQRQSSSTSKIDTRYNASNLPSNTNTAQSTPKSPVVETATNTEARQISEQTTVTNTNAEVEDATSLYDLVTQQEDQATTLEEPVTAEDEVLAKAEKDYAAKLAATSSTVNASSVKTATRKSCTTGWFYSGELGTQYLVITNVVDVGKEVLITNPANGKSVKATVTGKLQPEELTNGYAALLSSAAQIPLGLSQNTTKLYIAEILK